MKSIIISKDKKTFQFNQEVYNLNAGNITLLIHRIIRNDSNKGLSPGAIDDANNIKLDFYRLLKLSIQYLKNSASASVETFERKLSEYFQKVITVCNHHKPTIEVAILLGCYWLVVNKYLGDILVFDGIARPIGRAEADIYKSIQLTIERL